MSLAVMVVFACVIILIVLMISSCLGSGTEESSVDPSFISPNEARDLPPVFHSSGLSRLDCPEGPSSEIFSVRTDGNQRIYFAVETVRRSAWDRAGVQESYLIAQGSNRNSVSRIRIEDLLNQNVMREQELPRPRSPGPPSYETVMAQERTPIPTSAPQCQPGNILPGSPTNQQQ